MYLSEEETLAICHVLAGRWVQRELYSALEPQHIRIIPEQRRILLHMPDQHTGRSDSQCMEYLQALCCDLRAHGFTGVPESTMLQRPEADGTSVLAWNIEDEADFNQVLQTFLRMSEYDLAYARHGIAENLREMFCFKDLEVEEIEIDINRGMLRVPISPRAPVENRMEYMSAMDEAIGLTLAPQEQNNAQWRTSLRFQDGKGQNISMRWKAKEQPEAESGYVQAEFDAGFDIFLQSAARQAVEIGISKAEAEESVTDIRARQLAATSWAELFEGTGITHALDQLGKQR